MTSVARSNLRRYRAMSEPFESDKAANDAVNAFFEELSELRQKHRIADILTVIKVNVIFEGDTEGEVITHGHLGDTGNSETMAAYVFGRLQAERKEHIAKLLKADPQKSLGL